MPMTIGVPGNVPYVITVGAMTDNYTPVDSTDDKLASFSSTGPTYEGFVKPEVVAPGGHIAGSLPFDGYIASLYPGSMLGSDRQFKMSGTSQATAIVSGIVALMLQQDPIADPRPGEVPTDGRRPDRPSTPKAKPPIAVFQQGAGLVNALAAVGSGETDCANRGLEYCPGPGRHDALSGPGRISTTRASTISRTVAARACGTTASPGTAVTMAKPRCSVTADCGAEQRSGRALGCGVAAKTGRTVFPGRKGACSVVV